MEGKTTKGNKVNLSIESSVPSIQNISFAVLWVSPKSH